jgi:hypothetical protein
MVVELTPGANPTVLSYNASVVIIYNATNSITHICNKKYFVPKFKNALAYYKAGVVL